jgi:sensory rhodopsin
MILQEITEASFFLAMLAMLATALFMLIHQNSLPDRFKNVGSVSIVLLSIAGASYYFMLQTYQQGVATGGGKFPTHIRYVDWILTTPLLLLEFPLLLGVGKKGAKFMKKLVILDILMILSGYIAELNSTNPPLHYGMFFVSCLCWLAIAFQILMALQTIPPHVGPALRGALKFISMLFLLGWAVYPLGFLSPLMQIAPDVRELCYNIADVINKVGPAIAIFIAIRGTQAEEAEAYYAEEEAAAEGN